jgi:hypothetical protein
MGIPTVPLTDLYSTAGDYIRARGGEIQFRAGVESFRAETSGVSVTTNGQEQHFDYLILAVSFDVLGRLLPDTAESASLAAALGEFSSSPITGIHLWFDRQISDLDHAVLLDRTIQWMFHKSRLIESRSNESRDNASGSYVELVVSCSRGLVEKSKAEIVEMAVREAQEFFQGSARDLFAAAGHRQVPAPAGDGVAASLSGGRLDGDRLARHHGGCGPQRLSGSGSVVAIRRRAERAVSCPRSRSEWLHEAPGMSFTSTTLVTSVS